MEWVTLLVLVVVVLLLLSVSSRKRNRKPEEFPYNFNKQLFSPSERSFYGVLSQAVKDEAIVLGKVRVADILTPSKGLNRSDWQKAFNRISAKHFDYVICSPETLTVLSVVELDDKSHARVKRAERDIFLESASSAAGITLHRFKAAASYNIGDVRRLIFPPQENVTHQDVLLLDAHIPDNEMTLHCPKCSSSLVEKVAKKGKRQGEVFLACSAFPKCHYSSKLNP